MKLFASQAKNISDKAKLENLNSQRRHVLKLIESRASVGETTLNLSCLRPSWELFPEDLEFFYGLGYELIYFIPTNHPKEVIALSWSNPRDLNEQS